MKNKRGKVLVNFPFQDVAGFKETAGSWALIGNLDNFDERDGANATFEGGYVDGTVIVLDLNDHHFLLQHAGDLLSAFASNEFRSMQADSANVILVHGPVVQVEDQQRCLWVVAGTEDSDFHSLLAAQIIQATTPLGYYVASMLDVGSQELRQRASQLLIDTMDAPRSPVA
jgi:hypothetical protein